MLVQKKTKLNCLIIVFYFVFFTQISAQTTSKIQMGFSGSLLSGKTKYNNFNGLQSKSFVTTDMSFSLLGLWSEGPCEVFYVNEDYLIFENGINMMIADYSDPANLNIVSQFQFPGSCYSLILSGDHIYTVCYTVNGTELIITDISDILNPEIVGSCVANSVLRDEIHISGDYVYVLSYKEFEIFNISDPANPVSISQFSDFGPSPGQYSLLSLAISGDYVYVSASKYGEYGITMVDISDPNDPEYFKTISSDFS
ncbi:MAG: hypothetical protein GY863_10165, partial [bacterium]|nr:hypothetical protein [bacterium]